MERGAEQATQIMKAAGPFLARLPTNVAKEIIGAATVRRFRPREVILQQGKVGEHLHIVGDGEVEVVRTSKDDISEVLLVTLGTGECFGEMSLLTGEVTSATVRSKGDSTILLLDRERLETLLGSCPALGRVFSKLLADRLKASNVSLESELDRGILGKLSLISMIDLVQTLNASRRTGLLILTYRGMEANLSFRDGRMVGAKVGDLTGEEAFYAMLSWPDGDFCFEQSEVQDAGEIQMDTMGLLMEGLRRMDDLRRGDKA
jgi:CRP-like cAMP-binding protein